MSTSRHILDGVEYHDDRMYVLHICRCKASLKGDCTETTVYHESPPPDARWCVLTYRNIRGYPGIRVDHFDTFEEAQAYQMRIEPLTPLVSLGGRTHQKPLSCQAFMNWKKTNGLEEFDYRAVYTPGGANPKEIILTKNRVD